MTNNPSPMLNLQFLGTFTVTRNGTPVTSFRSDKARALLAYLAIERDYPHARSTLCALLWPDMPETTALQNLRQTLSRLRHALGDLFAADELADASLAERRRGGLGRRTAVAHDSAHASTIQPPPGRRTLSAAAKTPTNPGPRRRFAR